jgi:hypothetical protein
MERELDFNNEAANLREVAANLRRAGIDAVVPAPIEGLVGKRAFAMACASRGASPTLVFLSRGLSNTSVRVARRSLRRLQGH